MDIDVQMKKRGVKRAMRMERRRKLLFVVAPTAAAAAAISCYVTHQVDRRILKAISVTYSPLPELETMALDVMINFINEKDLKQELYDFVDALTVVKD